MGVRTGVNDPASVSNAARAAVGRIPAHWAKDPGVAGAEDVEVSAPSALTDRRQARIWLR